MDQETRDILVELSRVVSAQNQRLQAVVTLLVERNVFTYPDLRDRIISIEQQTKAAVEEQRKASDRNEQA